MRLFPLFSTKWSCLFVAVFAIVEFGCITALYMRLKDDKTKTSSTTCEAPSSQSFELDSCCLYADSAFHIADSLLLTEPVMDDPDSVRLQYINYRMLFIKQNYHSYEH